MNFTYQDTKKAEILEPLRKSQIEACISTFELGDDDGDEPYMMWSDAEYPAALLKLTKLFSEQYGKAAENVADAYICGFVRGLRAGIWVSFKALKPKRRASKAKKKKK